MKKLNAYDPDVWRENFPQTDIYRLVQPGHEHVIYTFQEMNVLKAALHHTVYAAPREILDLYHILDACPYYYLQWLWQAKPNVVVDIGCGTNPFQALWPNIVAIDDHSCPPPICSKALRLHVNQEFSDQHCGMADAIISCLTLHFNPIQTVQQQLEIVARMLRPGGRAYVSFNAETWLMCTPQKEMRALFGLWPDAQQVMEYIYQQAMRAPVDYLVSDWPCFDVARTSPIREELNGNIRLVFQVDNRVYPVAPAVSKQVDP